MVPILDVARIIPVAAGSFEKQCVWNTALQITADADPQFGILSEVCLSFNLELVVVAYDEAKQSAQ